jgi:hypothetical protein
MNPAPFFPLLDRLRPWLAGIVLVGLATLPFAGSLSDRRLWDDAHYVFDNPTLADRAHGVARIWAGDFLMDYYPVPQTVLWAEYGRFGQHPLGYRVANILLHAGGAIAVWWAARSWRLSWPWLVAAVWACHPTHCDAVCWIAQHKSTVATIFFATAAALAAKPAAWHALAVVAHGLACLSKTDAVMLPAVLITLELWRPHDSPRASARALTLRILPYAVVSLVTAAGAANFMATRVVTTPIELGTPVERLLKAGWAICFYVADTVWPVRLAAAYPLPEIRADDPAAWLPLTAVGIAAGMLGIAAWRGRPAAARGITAGAGAFVALLTPVLMILPQGFFRFSLVADRYLHLPLLAAAALAAAGCAAIAERSGRRISGVLAAGGLVVLLVAVTALHAPAYRSEETLWRGAIAAQPRAWFPYHGLGTTLLNEGGDATAAIPLLETAAAMHGTHPVTWFNLGLALIETGRPRKGREMLARAVALEPRYAVARRALEELDRRLDADGPTAAGGVREPAGAPAP